LKEIQGDYRFTNSFYESLACAINYEIRSLHSYYYGYSLDEVRISKDYISLASMAIMVQIDKYYYLVKTNDELDCLIASKNFIPSNKDGLYGLFGRANKTIANQEAYQNLLFDFTVTDYKVIENDVDPQGRNRTRTIFCCNMNIRNPSKKFIKDLENSKDIIKIPIMEYAQIIQKGTPKVAACLKNKS
jgi:hypothetical protein